MGPALLFGSPSGGVEGGEGSANTYSGRAVALKADASGTLTLIADSGPVSSSGGALQDSLITANLPGLLTAEVLHATVVAQGNYSRAEASVADLSLTIPGTLELTAGLLMARAVADCAFGAAAVRWVSEIAALTINGAVITASGQPNQTVTLPGAVVLINEQVAARTSQGTINALHVVVPDPLTPNRRQLDLVIASAYAEIHCGRFGWGDGDFISGGGWIDGTPSRARGTFAMAGGLDKKILWGHLTYIDRGGALQVQGTGIISYKVINATTRLITGTCAINRQSGFTYTCIAADEGEPGCDDAFSLMLSNGYSAGGNLAGGNIQLHKPATSK
jgi:hypothetical protein